MTYVFSVPSKDVYLDIDAQDDDTILLTIQYDGGKSEVVRVDPADLARELITASPSFALAIGEIAQKAILGYFAEDVNLDVFDPDGYLDGR